MAEFTGFALTSALLLAAVQGAGAIWSWRAGRWMVADVLWGPGLAGVALLGVVAGSGGILCRCLLAGIVSVWAARLARHVGRRLRGQAHDDPRYEQMARDRSRTSMVLRVFGAQGAIQWVVSLPIQVVAVAADPSGWTLSLVIAGTLIALGGIGFEAVGDLQLERYKQLVSRPPVMDRGLWGWTRHPNYFGDACVWIGVFVIACATWPGVLTVASPIVMTALLVWGSGARLTERAMADRPGYADYQSRTSSFVPRPPRKR